MSGYGLWYYQRKLEDESTQWEPYGDIEMDIIEEAFQEGKVEVNLGTRRINFLQLVEIKQDEQQRSRPVRREFHAHWNGHNRSWRFLGEQSEHKSSTYKPYDAWCPLLTAWFQTSTGKAALVDFSKCVDACVDGILAEAAHHPEPSLVEAKYIVSKIRQHAKISKKAVSQICVHFYTKNSFLYPTLNQALRDEDLSKVDTLGPICYLIRNHCRYSEPFSGTTYRGVQLSEEEIIDYENDIGLWKTWSAYTSTSQDQEVAEAFGNTLFIISLTEVRLNSQRAIDISPVSHYPKEREVLIPAGTVFQILSVKHDESGKVIITVNV